MKSIDRSWQSGNERADNIYFWQKFGFNTDEVFTQNTDGIVKGTLFEFKNNIPDLNKVLVQAIHYLSNIRIKGGIPIPTKIVLIDISKNHAYVYDAVQYREEIKQAYSDSASKKVENIVLSNSTHPINEFDFLVDQPQNPRNQELKKYFDINKYQAFDIEFPNVLGWAKYIYNQDKTITKTEMFEMLKHPNGTFMDGLILPWTGKEEDFSNIMDALNDPTNKKDLGAFYTPLPYVKEATKLLRKAIKNVPQDKDYVIVDRCAGTGALEHYLTDEELSHVIINTYEIKEWIVLYNRFVGKVRGIIPPLSVVTKDKGNLVASGDALAKDFLNTPMETIEKHKTLQEVINDKNVVIIGLENPPYSNELARAQEGNVKSKEKFSYIRKLMSDKFTGDSNYAKDLINQFIWSFEQFFMRTKYDQYVLFAPAKYWKSVGLMKKQFVDGFLANRGNFKASESAILVALWKNIPDEENEIIEVTAKEIWYNNQKWGTGKKFSVVEVPENAILKDVASIKLKKVHKTLGELYSKKKPSDVPSKIATGYDGYPTPLRKYGHPVYNDDIIAVIEASGFGLTPQDIRMTRIALYHGRGSQVRKYNYAEQTPLFVAKKYPQRNWYERDVYYTTADKGIAYQKDINFLRKSTLWTCISQGNHCLSFNGSDGKLYLNEMCLDPKSLVRDELINQKKFGELDKADLTLLNTFDELFALAKETPEYESKFQYGTYQIEKEINTIYEDDKGKKVYNNEKVNTKLKELKILLNEYYQEQLEEKLFKYELIK